MARRNTGILRKIRRLIRERRGVSAVEFAMLLPVMLTLYLGGTEITQGITIKRKTTMVARTVGDLVAQDTVITTSEMNGIFAAASAVIVPYPSANLKVVVSSVAIDAQKVAKVKWSEGWGGGVARTVGSTITLPQNLNDFTNTTLIWTESEYTYTPPVGYMLTGSLKLTDQLYQRPRLVGCISRDKGSGPTGC